MGSNRSPWLENTGEVGFGPTGSLDIGGEPTLLLTLRKHVYRAEPRMVLCSDLVSRYVDMPATIAAFGGKAVYPISSE